MGTGSLNKSHETESEVKVNWEIDECLSRLKKPGVIRSPSFNWSSETWELEMNPNHEDNIAFYLKRTTSEKIIKVIYKFGVQLIDGTTEMRSSTIHNFGKSSGTYGITEVIYKSELEERKQELLPAGILTFSCTITHLDTLIKPQNIKYESLDVLSSNFKALYNCSKNSDITVVVDEQKYPVHKAILAARSDVFAAMFEHDMEEIKTGIINVSDCDPDSFKDFLLYLYTGKVENFSSSNVCHLYRIADKYNVKELKEFCVMYMKRNLAVTNMFNIATLASHFEETGLISLAQEFFKRNALEIMKGDDWEQFLKQRFSIANQLLISMVEKAKFDE